MDDTILNRLAKGFEDVAGELRQLVEEKDAAVSKRDLAGTRIAASADQPNKRGRMMWRAFFL